MLPTGHAAIISSRTWGVIQKYLNYQPLYRSNSLDEGPPIVASQFQPWRGDSMQEAF